MGNSNGKPVVLTDQVNLNHFRLLRVVGKGAFGKVRIVERKDTGLTFALKYIRKEEVVRSESVRNIIRERRMLEHLNHPFLVNLRYSFQDVEYLYIVVDLMTGGDLRFHISRKTFTEEAVRFWMAELGCALRYVHRQRIVHRDVKPDNVLLDSEGHVHLADFNVASDFSPSRPLTSKSGTLAYLAPEVYMGRGYASEVDWWSLGVTFYECIYNKRPFEGNSHETLSNNIVKAEPPFPITNPPVSMVCLHAISSLLEKNKSMRIGAAGFETFTDNPFFRGIDFEALERKEVEPVFCPSSEKTNFDATYDLEELLLEEAPLEARTRKQKPRAELREDATQQEIRADELHRMVETMFEPFNYTLLPQDRQPVAPGAAKAEVTTPTTSTPSPARSRSRARTSNTSPADPSSLRPDTNVSRTRSATTTPDGSPPLAIVGLARDMPAPTSHPVQTEYFPPLPDSFVTNPLHPQNQAQAQSQRTRALRYDEPQPAATLGAGTPAQQRSRIGGPTNPRARAVSGGAPSATLSERPSWSNLNNPNNHPGPADETTSSSSLRVRRHTPGALSADPVKPSSGTSGGSSGMLGFLSRRKGRDRSPKTLKEKERGVLGKEGARVVVSHG